MAKRLQVLRLVIHVLHYPLVWVRRLTIPPCNDAAYHLNKLIVWPFFGLPFIVWAITKSPQIWWLGLIPVAVILAAVFFFTSPADPAQPPRYFFLICVLGTLIGILWTKIVCELLIDTLFFAGTILNLSPTYLGLTVIAVGAGLPDSITTIALAKNGQAVLGLTGGYAGQLFGLLVGFGASMLKKNIIERKPVEFDLLKMSEIKQNMLQIIVLFTALLVMLMTVGWNGVTGLVMTRAFGWTVVALYLVFFAFATTYTIIYAVKTF